MTPPITTVALCSATGKLGPLLLKSLQSEGFIVTVISRKSSTTTFPADQKITTVSDDYRDEELVSAFRGQDAVVLCLSFEMLGHSKRFAEASIAAGSRWLVASTYAANLEDPQHALFPASRPHRQAVDELHELQKRHDSWAWTSITCGPWSDLAVAAGAWKIDASRKTATLVDGGRHVFSSTTREQVALAAAQLLKKQAPSMKNTSIYVASHEINMLTWLNAYQEVVGADGWEITNVESEALLAQSNADMAAGNFHRGYMGIALAVCTGPGFENHFSKVATLANEELKLPTVDVVETVRYGLSIPNPFA